MTNPVQVIPKTGEGPDQSIAVRAGMVPVRDLYIPAGVYGYQFTLPGDGEWYKLNTPGMGYFHAAMPALPAGSQYDRALRSISVKNLSTTQSVQLGGVMNADTTLVGYPIAGDDVGPRERVAILTSALSNVAMRNPNVGSDITVSVLLVTDDL